MIVRYISQDTQDNWHDPTYHVEEQCISAGLESVFHPAMRDSRDRVRNSQDKVKTFLVPHIKPFGSVPFALGNKIIVFHCGLLSAYINQVGVKRVPLDVTSIPSIQFPQHAWKAKHYMRLCCTWIIGLAGPHRTFCDLHYVGTETCINSRKRNFRDHMDVRPSANSSPAPIFKASNGVGGSLIMS